MALCEPQPGQSSPVIHLNGQRGIESVTMQNMKYAPTAATAPKAITSFPVLSPLSSTGQIPMKASCMGSEIRPNTIEMMIIHCAHSDIFLALARLPRLYACLVCAEQMMATMPST